VVKFVWRHSIARPKPPVIRKDLGDISYIGRVMADFVRNNVAKATVVGRGWSQRWLRGNYLCACSTLPIQSSVSNLKSVWRHSIARPRKTPGIRKVVGDISYIGRVIADFVPKFVAMATGVGRSRIWMASFNSAPPKTPYYTQRSRGLSLI